MIVAAIVGVVVGYGLALVRERSRLRECERDCAALREYRRQRIHQDLTILMLYRDNDKLARQVVLQARCDDTRSQAEL